MLFDVYDDCTGENYSTHWTRAAAQAAVDRFHDENEISIEGETPRAVAPVWQRWDWRAWRLADGRGQYPNGLRSLNAGVPAPYAPWWERLGAPVPWRGPVAAVARALASVGWWLAACRSDGWRNARCGWCGIRPTMVDDVGFWFITPDGTDSRPCCKHCHTGPLGELHRARYGVGER